MTVVLVAGAGSGIGAAAARLLASEGSLVCCADLSAGGAEASAKAIAAAGGRATHQALDARDEAAWDRVVGALVREHGGLDVLVNSVGVSAAAPLPDMTFDDWRRVLSANLDAAFLATRAAVRVMRERGGAIVHVGSASGRRPPPGAAAYAVSKAALTALVQATAKECRAAGWPIRINAVSPAGVKTPMWRSMPFFQDLARQHGSEDAAFAVMEQQGGPFAEPDDVARAIVFLASDRARQITGVDLAVDGGYTL